MAYTQEKIYNVTIDYLERQGFGESTVFEKYRIPVFSEIPTLNPLTSIGNEFKKVFSDVSEFIRKNEGNVSIVIENYYNVWVDAPDGTMSGNNYRLKEREDQLELAMMFKEVQEECIFDRVLHDLFLEGLH